MGLLTVGDGWFEWFRIIGSVVVGAGVAAAVLAPGPARIRRMSLYVFVGWTVVLWARSMIVTWSGGASIQFKMVHTVLAAGFGLLCWWASSLARSDLVAGPDQADGEE